MIITTMDSSNNRIIIDSSNNRINNYSPDWGIMLTIQSSLNLRIGTQAWKKYISAAFWNYISTPINFTITLFTALTAGQTGTQTTYLTEKQEINKYSQKESIENVNYFTELIYICFHCFFEDNLKRINKSDRFWYLDGLSPDPTRKRNPWNINTKEYFLYDISGQTVYLDEEEIKEKNDKYKITFDRYSKKSNLAHYKAISKRPSLYDIESNSIDSYSNMNRKLNKNEIIEDINKRENDRLNELKLTYVKDKIEGCLENKRMTIRKIDEYTQKNKSDLTQSKK